MTAEAAQRITRKRDDVFDFLADVAPEAHLVRGDRRGLARLGFRRHVASLRNAKRILERLSGSR